MFTFTSKDLELLPDPKWDAAQEQFRDFIYKTAAVAVHKTREELTDEELFSIAVLGGVPWHSDPETGKLLTDCCGIVKHGDKWMVFQDDRPLAGQVINLKL